MDALESLVKKKEEEAYPKLTTKELARSMGLVRKPLLASSTRTSKKKTAQSFAYLIVIDFESTCWKDRKLNYAPEIIEFPAVLLNTSTGSIESEFHMYAQPSEQPRLSQFCTELTGINQELKQEKRIQFPCEQATDKENLCLVKWCSFVTWSDWDLGVCLRNECRRKQLRVPHPLRSWIDLRATYKCFYSRKPQGLAGALQDVGIKFSGRQHSGLDDARNTAKLAWRMMSDGCVLKLTKALDGPVQALWDIVEKGLRNSNIKDEKGANKNIEPWSVKTAPKSTGRVDSERRDGQSRFSKAGSPRHTEAEVEIVTGVKEEIPRIELCGKRRTAHGEKCAVVSKSFTKILKRKKMCAEELNSLNSPKVSVLEPKTSLPKTNCMSLVMPVTCFSALRNSDNAGGVWQGRGLISESLSFSEQSLAHHHKTGLMKQTVRTIKNNISGKDVCETDQKSDTNSTNSVPNLTTTSNNEQTRPRMSCYQVNGRLGSVITFNQKLVPTSSASRKLNTVSLPAFWGSVKNTVDGKQACLSPKPKLDFCFSYGGKPEMATSVLKDGNSNSLRARSSCEKSKPSIIGRKHLTPTGPLACFNGRRVTPPLCSCGRRSRRRSVMNPGPNQGRVYYTCPQNHGHTSFGTENTSHGQKKLKMSCNFFHWESDSV